VCVCVCVCVCGLFHKICLLNFRTDRSMVSDQLNEHGTKTTNYT